jgi:hypothetical protein
MCANMPSAKPKYEKIKKKVGIMIIPPPIPNNPAKTPDNVPSKKYKKISKNPF